MSTAHYVHGFFSQNKHNMSAHILLCRHIVPVLSKNSDILCSGFVQSRQDEILGFFNGKCAVSEGFS